MRELYTLVFTVSAVLIGAEVLSRLFPEKSGSLVHALAVLMVAASLLSGIRTFPLGAPFHRRMLRQDKHRRSTRKPGQPFCASGWPCFWMQPVSR